MTDCVNRIIVYHQAEKQKRQIRKHVLTRKQIEVRHYATYCATQRIFF